jgi:hypothetical protein
MTGEASYIELGVRDADTARTFYGRLLGWQVSGESGWGQVDSPTLSIGIHDGDESSIFEVFFSVDDLDASLAQVARLGGRVTSAVNESPGFGRWAECEDDQGVRFGLREMATAATE